MVTSSAYALCDVGSPWQSQWKIFDLLRDAPERPSGGGSTACWGAATGSATSNQM
ncbi:hypothetical protein TIFTF001_025775 [Ficus carica]|uniref:Uncharacterized protein n=1 Tax=Ficus carica TaxID=3494 RepID=A0AA88ANH2_FICCA|nr:hypothetical protein TIFTF001_025775 [Ficus carica]